MAIRALIYATIVVVVVDKINQCVWINGKYLYCIVGDIGRNKNNELGH